MRRACSQRGSILVVVLVILIALLAVGAVAVRMLTTDTRGLRNKKLATDSRYCAEAGLNVARPVVAAHYADWNDVLDGEPYPDWYPIRGDLDQPADGVADYEVTIADNNDEFEPTRLNPARDNDLKIILESKCLKFERYNKTLLSLIELPRSGGCPYPQAGQGCGNTGGVK